MIVDRERVAKALPGYVLGDQLGSGAFGLVLAGTHRQMGRPVAIKVMEATGTAAATADFGAEAQVLARLDHPHIVRVYDYVEDMGLCLVVMELLSGGTLTVRRTSMSPERVCAVALAVAAALEHAHGHKVLHRDIKADNILFAGDGTLKVTDFGISKLFEGSGTTTTGIAGTPAYMAPEQVEGGQLGPWTDLYALGIVLYSLFTGRLPFDPRLPLLTLLNHQLTEQPPPMDGVAAPLAGVVMHMLAKAPADRPADAATLALELASAAASVFGAGWTARGQAPLHLGDAVRSAADRPPLVPPAPPASLSPATAAPRSLSGATATAAPTSLSAATAALASPSPAAAMTASATLAPPSAPAAPVVQPSPAGPGLPSRDAGEGTPVPTGGSGPPASDERASEASGPSFDISPGAAQPSADGPAQKPPADPPAGSHVVSRPRRGHGPWIVGVVVLALMVTVGVVVLSPHHRTAPRQPTAPAPASASATTAPVAGSTRSPSARPADAAPPATEATIPPSGVGTAAAGGAGPANAPAVPSTAATIPATRATQGPTAYAIKGINGGDDAAQVPGSEADTSWVANDAACSAWLDSNGSGGLAGVLNTSLYQSCVAELFRSDGMAYTFSASWGAKKTSFLPAAGYTMWICVWNANSQSTTEVCSPRFGLNGTTPVRK